jgi:hypothetical protein
MLFFLFFFALLQIFTFDKQNKTKMFTSSDPNLPDLDFELVDERQQNTYLNESMIKDLLSSPTSTYRIVKPT